MESVTCQECGSSFETRHRDKARVKFCSQRCQKKAWSRGRSPEKRRDEHLRSAYGISLEEFNRILASQGGGCGICGRKDAGAKPRQGARADSMRVDHDHTTGEVRGILCSPCNLALGLFGDDVGVMQKAIHYLNP